MGYTFRLSRTEGRISGEGKHSEWRSPFFPPRAPPFLATLLERRVKRSSLFILFSSGHDLREKG